MTVNVAYSKDGGRRFGACELSVEQLCEWFGGRADCGVAVVPAGGDEPVEVFRAEFLYAVASAMYAGADGALKWVITLWTPTPERAERIARSLLPRLTDLPCGAEMFEEELPDRFRRADGRGPASYEDESGGDEEESPDGAPLVWSARGSGG